MLGSSTVGEVVRALVRLSAAQRHQGHAGVDNDVRPTAVRPPSCHPADVAHCSCACPPPSPPYPHHKQDTRAYHLRMMDDGEPDLDFPELDNAVKVVSTGERDFALCVRRSEEMVMHIRVEKQLASTGTTVLRLLFRLVGKFAPPAPGRQHAVMRWFSA